MGFGMFGYHAELEQKTIKNNAKLGHSIGALLWIEPCNHWTQQTITQTINRAEDIECEF